MADPAPRSRWLRWTLSVLATLFLAGHTLALIIAPAPPSYIAGQVYPLFKPYLRALNLDNGWAFFSPDPSEGRLLRYAVIDQAGQRKEAPLTEALHRWSPAYLRYTSLFTAMDTDTPRHIEGVAEVLCRRHAAEQPARIMLIHRDQKALSPDDFLKGHRPLDPAYVEDSDLAYVPCDP